jgi:hypothetical protein
MALTTTQRRQAGSKGWLNKRQWDMKDRKNAICLKLTEEDMLGLTIIAARKKQTPASFLREYVRRQVRAVISEDRTIREPQSITGE